MKDLCKNSLWNELIEQEVGCPVPKPKGCYILLKVYKRDEKTSGGLIIPSTSRDQDKYSNRVGLVLAMGEDAYECERFPRGPRCAVGDWVIYRRYELSLLQLNKVDLGFLYDDKICLTIDDPATLEQAGFDGRN